MPNKIHATGTLIENEMGEILTLLRKKKSAEGGTWGLVGGMIDDGEDKREAARREIFEEINVKFDLNDLSFLETFHWDRTDADITFEVFKIRVNRDDLSIKIQDTEVDEYQWIAPKEAFKRKDLMEGLYPILESLYQVG